MATYNQPARPSLRGAVPASRPVRSPEAPTPADRLARVEAGLQALRRMEVAGRAGRVLRSGQNIALPA